MQQLILTLIVKFEKKIRIDKRNEDVIDGPVLANKVKRRWPAIILAGNRTAKVPGRVMFLIVSIKTINGTRTEGVP